MRKDVYSNKRAKRGEREGEGGGFCWVEEHFGGEFVERIFFDIFNFDIFLIFF